ncbi:MAG: uroporphyrinogen decarboxylase family protein [Bacteroidota bacterium]
MQPRERVLAAINHLEADHCPIDIGGTDVTGINLRAYGCLLEHVGRPPSEDLPVLDVVQQLAAPSEDVLRLLHAHCRGLYPSAPAGWRFGLQGDATHDWFVDEWGITWRKRRSNGLYFDLAQNPLATASRGQLEDYAWPDPEDPARRSGLLEAASSIRSKGEFAVILSGLTGGGPMEVAAWMAGFQRFFVALARDPDWADALLDRVLETKLRFWRAVLPEVGPYVDIVSESEDLGTQDRLMISPSMFQRHIKPRLRQLFAGIKEAAPHVKILLHSDGAIVPILPDLIEIGVDILNPVQVSAKGMGDTAFLKREFGRDLVFWGGIDTQTTLPFGTPDEVRAEVQRRIQDLAPGGGYVLASVHNIQGDVPPENVMAMVEAWQDYG